MCEIVGFKQRVKEWRSYRWQEWRTSRRRWCDRYRISPLVLNITFCRRCALE